LLEQAKAEHTAKAAAENDERLQAERVTAKAEAVKMAERFELPAVWKRTGVVPMPKGAQRQWFPVNVYGIREFLVGGELRIAHGHDDRTSGSSYTKTDWLILPCSQCGKDAYVELDLYGSGGKEKLLEAVGKAANKPSILCTECKLAAEDARCSCCGQPYGMDL
jgi:ribosomal protein L37E